jgi:hypothetical protein
MKDCEKVKLNIGQMEFDMAMRILKSTVSLLNNSIDPQELNYDSKTRAMHNACVSIKTVIKALEVK